MLKYQRVRLGTAQSHPCRVSALEKEHHLHIDIDEKSQLIRRAGVAIIRAEFPNPLTHV